METFVVFKYQNVAPHANSAKFLKVLITAKVSNTKFAANPLLKTTKFSQDAAAKRPSYQPCSDVKKRPGHLWRRWLL